MGKTIIFHNNRCSKSRQGLEYLQSKGVDLEIVDYLKNPPTEKELAEVLNKLQKKPLDIIRKNEAVFKTQFKGKNFTDNEWIKIMVENPKLIERPIIIKGMNAVIARPLENIDNLLTEDI